MPKVNDNIISTEGIIVKVLPACKYLVRIASFNNHELIAYSSGKINSKKIKLIPGDKVQIEISTYDVNNGRIVWRLN